MKEADRKFSYREFKQFTNDIEKNPIKHIYLLLGNEPYFTAGAEKAILSRSFPGGEGISDALQEFNGEVKIETLINAIETAPFFAAKNVILLKNSLLFKEIKAESSSRQKLEARLISIASDMPDYSYLIIEAAKADKRRKLYKGIVSAPSIAILDAKPLRPYQINDWLKDKLKNLSRTMSREAEEYFFTSINVMNEVSLSFLDSEFDKLALYTSQKRFSREMMVAVFAGIPEVSVFALVDSINAKDVRMAIMLLHRYIADGIFFPIIIASLVRNVKQLWQIKLLSANGHRLRELSRLMGLNPYVAERLAKSAETFSTATLKAAFLQLADADYLLKTGQQDTALLEEIIIKLCTSKAH